MKKIFYFLLLLLPTMANAQLIVRIATIAGTGTYSFSGDLGPATAATMKKPNSVAVDKYNNVYFIDVYNQRVRKVTPAGIITSIEGRCDTPGFRGDNGPASAARVNFPTGVAVDTGGNVFIADYNNQRIRKINTSGIISTYAGNGTAGFFGDGGQATAAHLWAPNGIAVDKAGNLYIAEFFNYVIRKITPAGIVSTIGGVAGSSGNTGDGGPATAANFNKPCAVAVDKWGNVYVADGQNNRVRKIDAAGIIHNFAGDSAGTGGTFSGEDVPATTAKLYYPTGVAVDDSGYVYITDIFTNRVRVVTPAGIIKTVAGTPAGTAGYNGDGEPATDADLNNPMGLAVDTFGNVIVADYLNNRIRKLTLHCTPHAGVITGGTNICPCNPVLFYDELPGGTWSVSGGHSTINSAGWVHANPTGPGGVDTVTYTVQDTCGIAKVSYTTTILPAIRCDSMANIVGRKYLCLDSLITLTDTITGGTWSIADTIHAKITIAGVVHGLIAGLDTVKYTYTDSCGTNTRILQVNVLTKHQCDSVNSVSSIYGNNEAEISIFPNPATNILTIVTDNKIYTSCYVFNNVGKTVIQHTLNNGQTTLDIKALPTGMYYIRFIGNEGTQTMKFLKE